MRGLTNHDGGTADDVLARTRSAYSRLASDYVKSTRSFTRYPGLDHELRDFVESLPPGPLVDVGCGSGRDALYASSLGRRTAAVDSSYGMIHNLVDSEIGGRLVCGDALALPFRDRTFSGAIVSGVLLHLPARLCCVALSELRRVLTVGGQAIISMKRGAGEGWRATAEFPLVRWFAYYEVEEFSEMCKEVDLSPIKTMVSGRKDWFSVTAVRKS